MRRPEPQLIDRLAAEFVLGTLRGRARARFARWIHADERVAQAVRGWEDRFAPLAARVPPQAPAPQLWPVIAQRTAEAATRATATATQRAARPLRAEDTAASRDSGRRPAPWRAYALAASIALLAIGASLLYRERVSGAPWQPAAELRSAPNTAVAWRIEFDAKRHELRTEAEQPLPPPPSGAHELWALAAGAGPPVSLGVLPAAGRRVVRLNRAQLAAFAAATRLAVSEEPPTGSPTGLPTGKVVLVAPRAPLRFSS